MRGFRIILATLAMTGGVLAQGDLQEPPRPSTEPEIEIFGGLSTGPNPEPPEAAIELPLIANSEESAPDLFTRDTYKLTPMICPFKGEVDYDPEHVSCGLLEVPENREKSRGRKLNLHYVKLHAREPDEWDTEERGQWATRDDPIIYLTGGPGAKAAGYVKRFVGHGVRDVRDLYILEQRGIGFSNDFCPLYGNINPAGGNTPDYGAYLRNQLDTMESCFARAKAARVDLSAYNTIENARDVKALRRALGFDQWNVWGISYGSILGQAYLREDPEGIRAAVIDAIVPIDPEITFHGIGRNFQRSLDILKEACDADSSCATSFPDFIGDLKSAIIDVSENPIEVEDAIDKELFPTDKAWFFADLVGGATFIQLYEQDNYAALPAFISAFTEAVESRDSDLFKILTAAGGPGGFTISQGMYNAITCNDGWVTKLKQAYEADYAANPVLAILNGDLALTEEMVKLCKRYGMTPRDPEEYAPLQTDIRTLVVEGAMDPITPPPFAKAIMPGFSNGTYVEFSYAGHGPTRSVKCAGDFLTKFYDDPNGELDLSCPESMEAPKFLGPVMKTSALARIGAMAAEDEKQLAVPALWFGGSALALLIGAIIYNLAPVARLINGNHPLPTGGARVAAWATSLLGVASIVGLGYAGYVTSEASQFLIALGLVGWAKWFALAGLAAGLFGVGLLWLTVQARLREALPIGVLSGLLLTALGGVGLASFLIYWGVLPF